MNTALPTGTLAERSGPVKAQLSDADRRLLDFLVRQAVKSCS